MKKLISIIIPAWNEYHNLVELYSLLNNILKPLSNSYEFEIIIIDNHSDDKTLDLAMGFCESDSRWKYIRFSKNYGLEASFEQGVNIASGDAAIFLFSDMQDPPELIPEFIAKWEQGNDVVYGVIEQRADGKYLEKIGAIVVHKLLNRLSDNVIPENSADYQLISRKVINALKNCNERNRYFRGLVHSIGFKKEPLSFTRRPRKNGKTKMDILFRIGYAFTSITAFSNKPLIIISLFGAILTLVSFLGGLVYTVSKIMASFDIVFFPVPPLGWTTLILVMLFFNGINMLFLGVIGRYVSNIYTEVKGRPISVLDLRIGFEETAGD